MKSKTTPLILVLLSVFFCNAQNPNLTPGGGEFVFNPDKTPCITLEQRRVVIQKLQTNVEQLKVQNQLSFSEQRRGNHPLFIWPVQKAAGVVYDDVWAISGYVDHNAAFPNQLTDFNCGTITYDTSSGYNHQGVDIYTWPFTWKLMDDDGVEIIAAADGQIIDKGDGEFDRSCNFNNNVWNAVYVQHNDGSVAWYGHMKSGSVTTKNIGDMVSAGEVLGIVGSSGNSTGPHLHFEVYTDITYTQLIDPYFGTCNPTVTESWWQTQKPYLNPKINAVLTHSQPPNIFPACPTTETPYIKNDFDISDDFYFACYIRDQTAGDIVSFEIIRPNNSSLFNIWNQTATTTASSWYYLWGNYAGYIDMVGEWKWQVTFAGETVTHTFNVTDALSVEEDFIKNTKIYPNPFKDFINISSNQQITKVTITDILGKKVTEVKDSNIIEKIDLSAVSNGLYFITLETDNQLRKTVKLIKE